MDYNTPLSPGPLHVREVLASSSPASTRGGSLPLGSRAQEGLEHNYGSSPHGWSEVMAACVPGLGSYKTCELPGFLP